MDFHTLSRKELQALSKMNKIPANITNVAMADALSALPHVNLSPFLAFIWFNLFCLNLESLIYHCAVNLICSCCVDSEFIFSI